MRSRWKRTVGSAMILAAGCTPTAVVPTGTTDKPTTTETEVALPAASRGIVLQDGVAGTVADTATIDVPDGEIETATLSIHPGDIMLDLDAQPKRRAAQTSTPEIDITVALAGGAPVSRRSVVSGSLIR